MKKKLVLWGNDAEEKRVLIALQLNAEENKVSITTFPDAIVTDDFSDKMMKEWRNNKELDFPEGFTTVEKELTMSESLLPEELKVERTDVITRAQTEWHFIVLSSKLNDAYQGELDDLKDRIHKLEGYDSGVWENLKGFWSKVDGQIREKNLFWDHANALKEGTNDLFGKMKSLRAKLDSEFQEKAKANYDNMMASLDDIEKRVENNSKLSGIFDELKGLQKSFRDTKLTKELRSKLWDRIDGAFKVVKEKRFGANAVNDNSPMDRLTRRYDGLLKAIEKMDRSISRDRSDLSYENKKIERTEGQLEMQIRQAKLKMIEDRIKSKETKLQDMNKTKAELDQKMAAQKDRDAKRQERQKVEEAKKAAEAKIAEEIKSKAEAVQEASGEKLEKAAEAIKSAKEKVAVKVEEKAEPVAVAIEPIKEEESPSLLEQVQENIEHAVEDAIDTAKAVGEVVADKVEDIVETIKDKLDGDDPLEGKEEENKEA